MLESGAKEHNVEVFKMRTAERCSNFFQDDLRNEIEQDFQVALIKSNDTHCVLFGPTKMVKEALQKIEAFN